jgi:hypothetical protein
MNRQFIMLEDSIQEGYSVAVEARVSSVRISAYSDTLSNVDTYISYPDARKLVEMLVKHTHPGHSIEPNKPVKAPQLILAWNSLDPLKPGQTFLHVGSEADATSNAEALKRCNLNTPIWLAQITKQYVQPNPTYEWKDL